jgi:hypothetical protein
MTSRKTSPRIAAVVGLTMFVAPLATAGCTSTSSGSGSASATGCATVAATGHTATLPIRVETVGTGVVPVIGVCFGSSGPYDFVVDTGTPQSVVTPTLATTLHLAARGSGTLVGGTGCTATAPEVAVSKWSMGDVPLAGQDLLSAPVPDAGYLQPPSGILGSDVLSRFNAARVDYQAQKLGLLTDTEQAMPAAATLVRGQGSGTTAAALIHGTPTEVVPISVLSGAGTSTATAAVSFGGDTPRSFVVGTGDPGSSVSQSTALDSGLHSASGAAVATGVGCSGSLPVDSSGSWAVGRVSLQSQKLAVATLPGPLRMHVDGVLGSGVLSPYKSVVLDYRGADLVLGAG